MVKYMSNKFFHHQLRPMERILMEKRCTFFYYSKKVLTDWHSRIRTLLETM